MLDAKAVAALLELFLFHPAVHGVARAPSSALIVGESVFWHHSSPFVYRILYHYVHRHHLKTRNLLDAVEWNGDAESVLHILSYQFLQ